MSAKSIFLLSLGFIGALAAPPAIRDERKDYDSDNSKHGGHDNGKTGLPQIPVQLGPRPYYLVETMDPSPLKDQLQKCAATKFDFKPTRFTIGHRGGGTLMFPEETTQSVDAGVRMGTGVQECDVTFTRDLELVCRHANCDLHTTTDVMTRPNLRNKCRKPFKPAKFGAPFANGTRAPLLEPASAECCTTDFTLEEFRTLCGKMDGFDPTALRPEDFVFGTPPFRTDLYSACGTVMSHRDFIKRANAAGQDFTPEVKTPQVPMPFLPSNTSGAKPFTQADFVRKVVSEYVEAKIDPRRVWMQSFLYADVLQVLREFPAFGRQMLLLDESADSGAPNATELAVANLTRYAKDGVRFIAPPLPYLVAVGGPKNNTIVPSAYARRARELGLEIVTWTLERSGRLTDADHGSYYYSSIASLVRKDGFVFELLHVLAQQVGIKFIFTDWAATTTFYANCFGLIR